MKKLILFALLAAALLTAAAYLLSGARSFRTRFDRELIGFSEDFASVNADVFSGVGDLSVSKVALADGYDPDGFTERQNEVLSLLSELGPLSAAELRYLTSVNT